MVTHVVLEHTHLLYGRHLDQVLLSALYGVAKVHALRQVTFKDIIAHYKRQPQARTPVFRTVAITLTDPDLQARFPFPLLQSIPKPPSWSALPELQPQVELFCFQPEHAHKGASC